MHCSRRRLLRRIQEFHVGTINKSAHTKKVWKLIKGNIYIYIYMCVCVCVCVCLYIYIYIYRARWVILRHATSLISCIWFVCFRTCLLYSKLGQFISVCEERSTMMQFVTPKIWKLLAVMSSLQKIQQEDFRVFGCQSEDNAKDATWNG